MLDRVSGASFRAISSSATVRHQRQDSAEPLWFAVMCRELWGSNATKELEFKTGRSDRTCRAWASGDSPPPVNILLMLLQDPECGAAILDHVMLGCEAPWWRDHQRALKIGRAAIAADE
jgi:hypothetical protein